MNKHFALAYLVLASLLPGLSTAAKSKATSTIASKVVRSPENLAGVWLGQPSSFFGFTTSYERRIDIFTSKKGCLTLCASFHKNDRIARNLTDRHGIFIKCIDITAVEGHSKKVGEPTFGFQATSGEGKLKLTLSVEVLTPDKIRVIYSDESGKLFSRVYLRRKVSPKVTSFSEEKLVGNWLKEELYRSSTSYGDYVVTTTHFYRYILRFASNPESRLVGADYNLSSTDCRLDTSANARSIEKLIRGNLKGISTILGNEVMDRCFFITDTFYVRFLDEKTIELLSTESPQAILFGLSIRCSFLGKYIKM